MTSANPSHLYLVAYDVRDDRRLRRVYRTMRGYGRPAQYSVFLCVLSDTQREMMISDLLSEIEPQRDRIMLVHLGPAGDAAYRRIRFLGRSLPLPPTGPTIV